MSKLKATTLPVVALSFGLAPAFHFVGGTPFPFHSEANQTSPPRARTAAIALACESCGSSAAAQEASKKQAKRDWLVVRRFIGMVPSVEIHAFYIDSPRTGHSI